MKTFIRKTPVVLLSVLFILGVLLAGTALATAFFNFPNDGDIPGVPLPASPFSSSLTETTAVGLEDHDDVYAIRLERNELLEMVMTLDDLAADDDFDLLLFPPATKAPILGAYLNKQMVAASENTSGASESIRYVPLRSRVGTNYVHVYLFYADDDDEQGGSGEYTITWSKTQLPTPSVTVAATRLVKYGAAATITGTATVEGAPMENFEFVVLSRPLGTTKWSQVVKGRTGANGRYSASVTPLRTRQYIVRTDWSDTTDDDAVGYGYSRAVTVTPHAYLAFGTTPKVAYRNRAFTVSGHLKPSHPASTRHVKIVAERWNGSRWVRVKSTYVRNSGTTWSGKVTLPYRGTWRLQAQVGADNLHAATNSARRKLTVR